MTIHKKNKFYHNIIIIYAQHNNYYNNVQHSNSDNNAQHKATPIKKIIQQTHSDSYNKRTGLIKELITP